MADALAVLGVLAGADVDLLFVDDRRADEVAARALAAELVLRVLRIGVELPEHLAGVGLEAACSQPSPPGKMTCGTPLMTP